jgi:predicted RNA binding protein YcfA (HicA-like mRNA interferase family)
MKWPRDVSGAEALKALERLDFLIIRQTSHVRPAQGCRRVTVPMHRNLVVGTLRSILRQAAEAGHCHPIWLARVKQLQAR